MFVSTYVFNASISYFLSFRENLKNTNLNYLRFQSLNKYLLKEVLHIVFEKKEDFPVCNSVFIVYGELACINNCLCSFKFLRFSNFLQRQLIFDV